MGNVVVNCRSINLLLYWARTKSIIAYISQWNLFPNSRSKFNLLLKCNKQYSHLSCMCVCEHNKTTYQTWNLSFMPVSVLWNSSEYNKSRTERSTMAAGAGPRDVIPLRGQVVVTENNFNNVSQRHESEPEFVRSTFKLSLWCN